MIWRWNGHSPLSGWAFRAGHEPFIEGHLLSNRGELGLWAGGRSPRRRRCMRMAEEGDFSLTGMLGQQKAEEEEEKKMEQAGMLDSMR